jgi:hypothetical protein
MDVVTLSGSHGPTVFRACDTNAFLRKGRIRCRPRGCGCAGVRVPDGRQCANGGREEPRALGRGGLSLPARGQLYPDHGMALCPSSVDRGAGRTHRPLQRTVRNRRFHYHRPIPRTGRSVDRAQERIRVEVLPQGVLRFRNLVGREREIPLRDAQSFEVKDLRGKPRLVSTMGGARRRNPFSGDVELRGRSGDRRSPHLTEIRVKDQSGKRHVIRLSGAMPVKEVRRLNEAINFVREV